MTRPRQLIMELIGKEGCYFLSIVRAGELLTGRRVDAVALYEDAVEKGYMSERCFVYKPEVILEQITGWPWKVSKEADTYKPRDEEVVILRFERKEGMATLAHFVLADTNAVITYDPYGDSKTVRDGRLVSMRIFREQG